MSLRDKLDQSAQQKIEEHWPKIQQVFQERVGPAALAAAQNDDTMRSVFKLAYGALPFPIRLAIKEDVFVQFCFSHRDSLLPSSNAAGTSA
jgi:hypothetical protein